MSESPDDKTNLYQELAVGLAKILDGDVTVEPYPDSMEVRIRWRPDGWSRSVGPVSVFISYAAIESSQVSVVGVCSNLLKAEKRRIYRESSFPLINNAPGFNTQPSIYPGTKLYTAEGIPVGVIRDVEVQYTNTSYPLFDIGSPSVFRTIGGPGSVEVRMTLIGDVRNINDMMSGVSKTGTIRGIVDYQQEAYVDAIAKVPVRPDEHDDYSIVDFIEEEGTV